MDRRVRRVRTGLRPTRPLLAALIALALAAPAAAVPVAFYGMFDDPTATESDGDVFSISNDAAPLSQSDILQIVIDLSSASQLPMTFDTSLTSGSPFAPTLGSDVTTGLVSATFTGNTLLTLVFSDFDPGETFSFTVDLDDNNTRVDAGRLAGATLTATFAAGGGTDVLAAMVDPPGPGRNTTFAASATAPEPTSLPLLGVGLILLALRRRARRRS